MKRMPYNLLIYVVFIACISTVVVGGCAHGEKKAEDVSKENLRGQSTTVDRDKKATPPPPITPEPQPLNLRGEGKEPTAPSGSQSSSPALSPSYTSDILSREMSDIVSRAQAEMRQVTAGANPPSYTSDIISRVQIQLKAQGFDLGSVDGSMGPKTREALRGFQNARRLQVTGEIDKETLEALGVRTDVEAKKADTGTKEETTRISPLRLECTHPGGRFPGGIRSEPQTMLIQIPNTVDNWEEVKVDNTFRTEFVKRGIHHRYIIYRDSGHMQIIINSEHIVNGTCKKVDTSQKKF